MAPPAQGGKIRVVAREGQAPAESPKRVAVVWHLWVMEALTRAAAEAKQVAEAARQLEEQTAREVHPLKAAEQRAAAEQRTEEKQPAARLKKEAAFA